MKAEIIRVDSAASTNSLLAARAGELAHGSVIVATAQTAGRGQRGNSWESEPGKNLTFSMLLRPQTIEARRQFELSMSVALSLRDAIAELVGEAAEVTVKWPNDIYAGDKKICGILIENTLAGKGIMHSVVGAGVNINQRRFVSDAPNPVSVAMLTGVEHELDSTMTAIAERIVDDFDRYEIAPDPEALKERYMSQLWRRDGYHTYRDAATGEEFEARIADVDLAGPITLQRADGASATYAFKEVAAVL